MFCFSAGLHPGDIITHVDKKPIEGTNDVYTILENLATDTLILTVFRNGVPMEIKAIPES